MRQRSSFQSLRLGLEQASDRTVLLHCALVGAPQQLEVGVELITRCAFGCWLKAGLEVRFKLGFAGKCDGSLQPEPRSPREGERPALVQMQESQRYVDSQNRADLNAVSVCTCWPSQRCSALQYSGELRACPCTLTATLALLASRSFLCHSVASRPIRI